MSIQFESDDETVGDDNFLCEWSKTLVGYGEKVGKTLRTADICGKLIQEAGFEDVSEKWYKVPVGPWAKDKRMKEIGFWNYHFCMEGCEGWALYAEQLAVDDRLLLELEVLLELLLYDRVLPQIVALGEIKDDEECQCEDDARLCSHGLREQVGHCD